MTTLSDRAIAGYDAAADELIARYGDLCQDTLFAPVARHLPTGPIRVLDVGAGPGHGALWFAAKGHDVTAVEPAARFRAHMAACGSQITIRPGRLPALDGVDGPFDLITSTGVWQHLDPADRPRAFRRLFGLLHPDGRLILSLRHGPSHPARPVAACDPEDQIALARSQGLDLCDRIDTASQQPANRAAGVTWTWLVLTKGAIS
ncbi:class I SAM-dependent methyltransferase [Boseongicola sp. H5]|uniref:class I SAM-dependent methyltransferase n=1 Tax=Boseongicola sp. H5 TaxID=2763261 RepID=UPI001D0A90AA|nr:class I SAM-dependent methyltransferase [Boseongicola sp. H5]